MLDVMSICQVHASPSLRHTKCSFNMLAKCVWYRCGSDYSETRLWCEVFCRQRQLTKSQQGLHPTTCATVKHSEWQRCHGVEIRTFDRKEHETLQLIQGPIEHHTHMETSASGVFFFWCNSQHRRHDFMWHSFFQLAKEFVSLLAEKPPKAEPAQPTGKYCGGQNIAMQPLR